MNSVMLVVALNLFHAVLGRNSKIEDKSYLIVVPKVFRAGTTVNIGVNLFGNTSCDVELTLHDSAKNGVVGRAKGHFEPNQPGKLELNVPWARVSKIGARVCGEEKAGKAIDYETPTKKIFIQTDKPIYKPGQKVLIRVVYLNWDLKPAGEKVSSVVIEEPSGSKIMQWTDVKLEEGIASLDLQLSKEPVLGAWKIRATIVKNSARIGFEVDKYVLPKFQLEIKPPSYLAFDQPEIPVSICARYTYGKEVTGRLETTICLERYRNKNDGHCFSEIKNVTGCEEFEVKDLTANIPLLRYGYFEYHLRIKAIFTETLTGIKKVEEVSTSRMQRYSKRLSFVVPEKFKPGFPFKFKVKLAYLDGKPVTDGTIKIKVTRKRFYYVGSRQLLWKSFPVKNGFVDVSLKNYMPHDTETLHFTANLMNPPLKFATSRALYSPSLSYVQLAKSGSSTAKVGSQGSVKVSYTVRPGMPKEIRFYYKILCRGNLVQSGTTNDILSESVISYFNPLIKPTASTDGHTHPFLHIPKPTVKEFEIKFNVTQEMVPSCRILVYYVRPDKETVGDSIVYDVEDTLENQVSVAFIEKQKKPGEKAKMILKARPGSRIAIAALDKSVLLLRNSNEIKRGQVVGILNEQDVGPSKNYNKRCLWSWNKPYSGDTSEAFNTAGVIFLSNLNIFTEPCSPEWPLFNEDDNSAISPTTMQPTAEEASADGSGEAPAVRRKGAADTRCKGAPGPPGNFEKGERSSRCSGPKGEAGAMLPEEPNAVDDEEMLSEQTSVYVSAILKPHIPATNTAAPPIARPVGKKKPIKRLKVRKNFPETWLWRDIKLNDTSGVREIDVQVPGTITSWVANGFAMSAMYGMGVSDRATLRAFQPFFVQMTLPYSVIRGEEIPVTVTVFNYLPSCVPIKLEMNRESPDYKVTSFYISKMCVCGDDGKSVKFRIIAKKLGKIPLTVKAITSEAKLCPKTKVYAADAVTRKLLVEPEGIKQEYTRGTFFCPKEGKYSESIDLTIPGDIVPGSVIPKISVVGDIMGPALTNLDGLLAMPYGCGEQNMAKFAPNIYIMDYLTNTNQITEKIKRDATHFMSSGYQRQLRYKRRSGSYSAFGNSDSQGSMMLTAFVVRSFARARKYIFIDEGEILHSIRWFKSKQRNSGCFPKYGYLFDSNLQGGVNSELTITAYVTIALLEAGLDVKTPMVSRALDCIAQKLDVNLDSYTTSLVTYTLVVANHTKAGAMMARLKSKAVSANGNELYWSASSDKTVPTTEPSDYFGFWYYRPPAADVEMTGYALMSYLKHKQSTILDATKIIKWLSKQRNNYGGFSSTQDTCVALQALSESAESFYGNDASIKLRISVNIENLFRHDFDLTADNKLVLQRAEFPGKVLPNKLNMVASGSGCAILQASVKYNIPVPEEVPAFKVDISVHRREATDEEEITACYPLQLKITAKWLKKGVSNMAIVDVKLVSGFSVNEELLEEKLEESINGARKGNFKRYEIDGQNVILYFDEIKTMDFTLDIIQKELVKKTKPGVVRVYDYYNPESEAKVLYNITEKDCYGEKVEKECPKCLSVDDFADLFDKNINCSSYLMRTKSTNGQMKVRRGYIKNDKNQTRATLSYEIPEFCPCDEIFDGVGSLVFAQNNYFRKNGDETVIVFNAGTTIARWNSNKMKKIFREKMRSKIYRRCWLLSRG